MHSSNRSFDVPTYTFFSNTFPTSKNIRSLPASILQALEVRCHPAHEPGKGNLEQKQVSPTLHTP
jgi:hypothetical protein